MIAAFLKVFLLANLLLALTYVFFLLVQGSKRIASHQLLRWGQAFVIVSILAPFSLSLLPGNELPEMKMPSFRSGGEGHGQTTSPRKATKAPKLSTSPAEVAKTFYSVRHSTKVDPITLIFLAWLASAAILATRLGIQFARLQKLLKAAITIRALGKIRISVHTTLAVPISALHRGMRHVVLPENLLARPSDWKLALKHELQHHRQGDTLWAVAIEWIACVFFFNPAIHLWKRRIIELQEFSCDEALVGQQRISKREYGSCLVRVAETALASREMYVGTTCMAAAGKNPEYIKSFLERRIEMLVQQGRTRRKWLGFSMGTIGLLATVSLAYGIERKAREVSEKLPNSGTVVVDDKIQAITEKILRDAIAKQDAREGFAIVAEPSTGRILAVANIDTRKKKTGFWALAEQFEPASIAKSLVVAEAIEQGKTTPEEKHDCAKGHYTYQGKEFHDWKTAGFGALTTAQAIAQSSDICTVKIAEKLGDAGVKNLLEKYGFGPEGTAREFPGSRVGQMPPSEGASGKFLVPYVAYGQGFRSTAIELVQAYGAIANGGDLLMPLAADAPDSSRKVLRRVLSAESAAKARGILREVVLSGTGKSNAGSYLYTTAGKTSSAMSPDEEWLDESRGTRKANVAGFIGFAPAAQPKVEVFVRIMDPGFSKDKGSGAHGAEHAAPVFRQIAEAVLQQMKVAPDNLL